MCVHTQAVNELWNTYTEIGFRFDSRAHGGSQLADYNYRAIVALSRIDKCRTSLSMRSAGFTVLAPAVHEYTRNWQPVVHEKAIKESQRAAAELREWVTVGMATVPRQDESGMESSGESIGSDTSDSSDAPPAKRLRR